MYLSSEKPLDDGLLAAGDQGDAQEGQDCARKAAADGQDPRSRTAAAAGAGDAATWAWVSAAPRGPLQLPSRVLRGRTGKTQTF